MINDEFLVCPYMGETTFKKNWKIESSRHRWTPEEAREMSKKSKEKREQIKKGEAFRNKLSEVGLGSQKATGNAVERTYYPCQNTWSAEPNLEYFIENFNLKAWFKLILFDVFVGALLGIIASILL